MAVRSTWRRIRIEISSLSDESSSIKRADQALYVSKDAGRNCAHFQNGAECIRIDKDGAMRARGEGRHRREGSAQANRQPDGNEQGAVRRELLSELEALIASPVRGGDR